MTTLAERLEELCVALGCTVEQLRCRSRRQECVSVRMIVCRALYNDPHNWSISEIGRALERHHSTVRWHVFKAEEPRR